MWDPDLLLDVVRNDLLRFKVNLHFCVNFDTGYPRGLLVDPTTGKRFVNELAGRKERADAIISIGSPVLLICDSVAAPYAIFGLSRALSTRVVQTFECLDELAETYQINTSALKETIKRYNDHIIALKEETLSTEITNDKRIGEDPDFGRQITIKSLPIEHPPYYTMRVWPKIHYCCGGVATDDFGRVLDEKLSPMIQNLYAVGEVTGGTHGIDRLGGCSLAECLVFGRRIGQTLIKSRFM